MLGIAYLMTKQYRDAVRELEIAARLEPELAIRQGYLAYAYARLGETARARAIVASLSSGSKSSPLVALAIAHLGLNENEQALAALERAVDVHDISLLTSASLVPDPVYDPLRNDPRFENILKRMNLWEYARK